MENTENKFYADSKSIMKLVERAKHTSAGLGGYLVYMIILLVILLVDTIYYEKHAWYDVDYDIYTGLLQTVIFFYATVYLFKGTEGYRIIYGWRRWVLGCVFAIFTLSFAFDTWVSVEQTGEEIHSKTGYTRTEMQEIRQSYLDEGYSEKDFQTAMINEISDYELYYRIFCFFYIASCICLWYWTVSVKKIENLNNERSETGDDSAMQG